MRLVLSMIRWIYQGVAGLCVLLVATLLSSFAFELPFKRANIDLRIEQCIGDPTIRLLLGSAAVFLVVLFFATIYLKTRGVRQEPSIAFDNPDGEVSISMRAIEDFVGRVGRDFTEVKSLEPVIVARREGVQIILKVQLWSGPNIPKLTERIQNVVKSQVQNILGIENVQAVTLSVSEILAREKDYQMPAQPDIFAGKPASGESDKQANIPYQS